MEQTAIIVGGGLAGLAAASALAERGIRVTLLESRPRLGGRATSIRDRVTGMSIDNCQHVAMGCCTNYLHFCQRTGIDSLLRCERELYFIGPRRIERPPTVNRFRASVLPAPLHLLPAFLQSRLLSWRDKLVIGRALRRLVRRDQVFEDRQRFSEWLAQQRQTPTAVDRFWKVVLVSSLSESLDRISVPYARKVFLDGFLSHRNAWDVWIPTVPLEMLYGERVKTWLVERHATVRLGSRVQRVAIGSSRTEFVELSNGERISADHYVLAVPHYVAPTLLSPEQPLGTFLQGIDQIESAPIASVHLWFDRPIASLPHAVLTDRLSQWMFNHSLIKADAGGEPTSDHYYQIVISGSRSIAGQAQEEVIRQVLTELCAIWPKAAEAGLLHSRLITEHRAVFSPQPGVDALRPPQQTPIANLQFAGDWTQTGWPSTMESAVRSGYLAAENILAAMGRPEHLLQPDLPVSAIARILLGIR